MLYYVQYRGSVEMNWRKILFALLVVITVTLFVITVRQHDTTVGLKEEIGVQYTEKVQNFRTYIQDIQSALDSGESISLNHYYSEVKSFPIKNEHVTAHMNRILEQLEDSSNGKNMTSEERKKLSVELNELQRNLIIIIDYSEDDSLTWYDMGMNEDSKVQAEIDALYEK